jgi:hypothetical protein
LTSEVNFDSNAKEEERHRCLCLNTSFLINLQCKM